MSTLTSSSISTPIVTLQKPKDISLEEIEAELGKIWHDRDDGKIMQAATRASTFSMIVYEPEEYQQLLAALGFYDGPIDGIHGPTTKQAVEKAQETYDLKISGRVSPETLRKLREEYAKQPEERVQIKNRNVRGFTASDSIVSQNPCRIITLCPTFGNDEGITAQVSAYCPIQKSNNNLVCCEYITLRGTKQALERASEMVVSLAIPDLPKFVWWKATPNPEQPLFRSLAECCNCIILDSSYFSDPEAEFLKMNALVERETYVADLNWHRLSAWQELTAAAFDPPERRAALGEVDRIAIDYEKGNPAQAMMFLGWIASRLQWEPVAISQENDDYDITSVHLTGPDGQSVEAELAGVPTADWGEIPGDLLGLRVTSTNTQADCCTILCSETTGCMRMESGGSAQSCRTEQVSVLSDRKAESLMAQQLQRWGRDLLYEESLAAAAKIIKLR